MSYNNESDRFLAIESLSKSIQNLMLIEGTSKEKEKLIVIIKKEIEIIKSAQEHIEPPI